MFEIPRRGRQARNFECSENSRSLSGEHKTKETYPTRQGSPTPCKQALSGETCHGWVQTCLSLFLPLVYLISSENNSIFRFEKTTFNEKTVLG